MGGFGFDVIFLLFKSCKGFFLDRVATEFPKPYSNNLSCSDLVKKAQVHKALTPNVKSNSLCTFVA